MDQGYKQIARKLSLPEWDDLSTNTFQIVSDWLSDAEHGPWLMVLDSADDLELFFQRPTKPARQGNPPQISQFIPRGSAGSIIITTRDKRVAERLADRQKPIAVPPMSKSEAEELLRSKLPDELVTEPTKLGDLVDALESLPLAISQAAAFMTENCMDVGDYLDALRYDAAEFLSEDLGDHRRHPDSENSVLATWKLSFEQIRSRQPRAAEVLSLMAVLDRNAIPKALLVREHERMIDFTLALGTLQAFSLIILEKDGKFALHRLVQLSTQRWLEQQSTKCQWQETALQVLVKSFPPGDFENWQICEALSPHVQVVIDYDFKADLCLLQRATLLNNLARFDDQQSRYTNAHDRYGEVIAVRKEILGATDPGTLQSMCYFGEVLFKESKYQQAEAVLREALEGRETVLGLEHPDTLMTLGHLAEVVRGLKRYAEAEKLFRRALDGKEDDLGSNIYAARNADNLGSVLRDAGRLEEAEKWVRLGLVARERLTGLDSPDTLGSISHLALIVRLRGQYDAAETLNKRALAGFEKKLGREHHFTLRSLDDLSVVFRYQGKLEAAEEQNRRALKGLSNVLGPNHRRTLVSRKNLAIILELQGKYTEAIELLDDVARIKKKEFGESSPEAVEISAQIDHVQKQQQQGVETIMQPFRLAND